MTINEWFSSGCNYKDGVALYGALPNHNKNYFRNFSKKESVVNVMKLKYELQKHLQPTTQATKPTKQATVQKTVSVTIPEPQKSQESKYYRKVLLKQLPVKLHPLYIKQKNDYVTYCSLKLQLNELSNIRDSFGNLVLDANGVPKVKPQTEFDIQKANAICLQIESLFDSIDKAWEIIDHYLDTKEVITIKSNDFSSLSPGKLRDKINSVRGSRTRQKKRLAMLEEKYNNAIALKFKTKYERNIAKCKEKLMQLDQDYLQLIQIRDNEQ